MGPTFEKNRSSQASFQGSGSRIFKIPGLESQIPPLGSSVLGPRSHLWDRSWVLGIRSHQKPQFRSYFLDIPISNVFDTYTRFFWILKASSKLPQSNDVKFVKSSRKCFFIEWDRDVNPSLIKCGWHDNSGYFHFSFSVTFLFTGWRQRAGNSFESSRIIFVWKSSFRGFYYFLYIVLPQFPKMTLRFFLE